MRNLSIPSAYLEYTPKLQSKALRNQKEPKLFLAAPQRTGALRTTRTRRLLHMQSPAGFAGRGAGMLSLELPRYLTGSVLFRREEAWRDCNNNRDDERPGSRDR